MRLYLGLKLWMVMVEFLLLEWLIDMLVMCCSDFVRLVLGNLLIFLDEIVLMMFWLLCFRLIEVCSEVWMLVMMMLLVVVLGLVGVVCGLICDDLGLFMVVVVFCVRVVFGILIRVSVDVLMIRCESE